MYGEPFRVPDRGDADLFFLSFVVGAGFPPNHLQVLLDDGPMRLEILAVEFRAGPGSCAILKKERKKENLISVEIEFKVTISSRRVLNESR